MITLSNEAQALDCACDSIRHAILHIEDALESIEDAFQRKILIEQLTKLQLSSHRITKIIERMPTEVV